jgi:hypothetical protein
MIKKILAEVKAKARQARKAPTRRPAPVRKPPAMGRGWAARKKAEMARLRAAARPAPFRAGPARKPPKIMDAPSLQTWRRRDKAKRAGPPADGPAPQRRARKPAVSPRLTGLFGKPVVLPPARPPSNRTKAMAGSGAPVRNPYANLENSDQLRRRQEKRATRPRPPSARPATRVGPGSAQGGSSARPATRVRPGSARGGSSGRPTPPGRGGGARAGDTVIFPRGKATRMPGPAKPRRRKPKPNVLRHI